MARKYQCLEVRLPIDDAGGILVNGWSLILVEARIAGSLTFISKSLMYRIHISTVFLSLLFGPAIVSMAAEAESPIPLAEHPRPDFARAEWKNLNGAWAFRFDGGDEGIAEGWQRDAGSFPLSIQVPFPWGSKLSGVEDEAQIGWYARDIEVPEAWQGKRIFVTIGASDWYTTAWLDGEKLGEHRGGYTPFSFELSEHVRFGSPQSLVIRVDDVDRPFTLEGKQGYGDARGIWQTVYLDARGGDPVEVLHFAPDLGGEKAKVTARLREPAPAELSLRLEFATGSVPAVSQRIAAGAEEIAFDVAIPKPRLWSLEDPFLYEVKATVEGESLAPDELSTYFGMREISVVDLPGTDIPYVALNGKPVYLQLTLDQSYHPEGFYTFESDEFLRDEVLRAREIGLNGLRVHVKIPIPRKLYWADRLGMLIMADVPNGWGEPTPEQRAEVEYALREMIARDYNHPSIFAWIPFNETWGLRTKTRRNREVYLDETKDWVVSVVSLAKGLDPTRLVEDNSVCCGVGHTKTDLNSWHAYLPGWEWERHLEEISVNTHPGSTWNFESGYEQARQPNINSEFGNVWGYEGSTGDVDWSWDYHRAINAFRRHPKVAGWLYTEHHDVINEWNGYWRFDRTEKITGMDDLAEGMTLRDLHAPLFVAVGEPAELAKKVAPGEKVEVPLYASFLSDRDAYGDELLLSLELYGWDTFGRKKKHEEWSVPVPYRPYLAAALPSLSITVPEEPGVYVLASRLETPTGAAISRNFTSFAAEGQPAGRTELASRPAWVVRVAPNELASSDWSGKKWDVLDGLKVNGAGHGHFEYAIPWPKEVTPADVASGLFLVEASAKVLYDKDRDDARAIGGDYMRGKGTHSPHRNPNAYPMTDETRAPSAVTVSINDHAAGLYELPDDPADHRGILSWGNQLRDRKLREAGSYGYLLEVPIPKEALEEGARTGTLRIRLAVDASLPGGLAIYGQKFGRYPLDPTVVLVLEK